MKETTFKYLLSGHCITRRHLHLEPLSHVLDEVGGLLPVALLLVGGHAGLPGGGICQKIVRKIPSLAPSSRRHCELSSVQPEVKIGVLA